MKVQKFIEVRLLKKRIIPVIDAVQYDTGIQLVFSLVDFDIPSGTTATLYVQKRSGNFVYQEDGITISGNNITINLENQALTEHGETKYQIMLKNGTDTVTTFAGILRIEKNIADSEPMTAANESRTVIRPFDEAVEEYAAEFQARAEQIVQACIATIPDDYTVMEAKVNELANAVKGNLSGAVVVADDVSSVGHELAVKVSGVDNPSTVKVTRCGKNLLNIRTENEQTVSGVTFTFDKEGKCTVSGTNNEANIIHVYATTSASSIVIKKGTTVTISGLPDNRKCCLRVFTNTTTGNTVGGLQGDFYETQTITLTEDTVIQNILVRVSSGATVDVVFEPMLEIGDTATEYERFKEPITYTPATDGTVSGLTSVSPNMTILTDTEGAIVECEYNRDTNKVIEKLTNAIIALGGAV